MLYAGFGASTMKLHFGQNSWPVGTSGSFNKNFSEFFFWKEFCLLFLDHKIFYLHVLVQKCRRCIPAKISDQSDKWAFSLKLCLFFFFFLTWQHCILVKILDQSELAAFLYKIYKTSSSFERVFHFILGPLNMLSVCFGAKTPTLYSG